MHSRDWLSAFIHAAIALSIGIITALIITGARIWYELPVIGSKEELLSKQSMVLFDRHGNELYRVFEGEDRLSVSLNDTPAHVHNAIIAIEDERFFTRPCIDIQAIGRAAIANIKNYKSEGASTITQQLVRSIYLTPEKTFERKIKEIAIACKMEQVFSKEEILTMYINWINFGGSNHGIEQASTSYFNTPSHNLTIAQSAVLAALPQRPTYFSPYGSNVYSQIENNTVHVGLLPYKFFKGPNEQAVLAGRTNQVLANMLRLQLITQAEMQVAESELLAMKFAGKGYNLEAPHFVFWLRDELATLQESANGMRVETTLHRGLQRMAERVVTKHAQATLTAHKAHNISLLAVDRATNEIVAYVGNTNYYSPQDGQVDMVQAPRQPGSSFKPFIYAAAFLQGITPNTYVQDEPITLAGYKPRNYEGGFFGRMTVEAALARSRNIPAIKAFFWAGGEEPILQLLTKMGVTYPALQRSTIRKTRPTFSYGWPLSLGSAETSLFEMVQGYTVFASNGILKPITAIRSVRSGTNNLLQIGQQNATPIQAIPATVATDITAILSNESARPAGVWRTQLTLPSGNAAKTGTSSKCLEYINQYCSTIAPNNTWVLGFNNNLVVGVWVGNADGSILDSQASGLITASPIWREFMLESELFYSQNNS